MNIAKPNELKQMFMKNLQLLPLWIRQTVMKIDEKELWEKVEVTYNEEGHPICRYREGSKIFKITSDRPFQEAEQWARNIPVKGASAIFMYGSGFAYSLFELFAKKQPHTLVVLFEENIYLFTAMLHYFDLEPIIMTKKIAFLIGDVGHFAKAFNKLFFSIVFVSCTSPVFAFTHAARRNFKIQYLNIHKFIFSQLGLFIFYIGNDHLDNLIGLCNLLANIKEIVKNPYISCLKDKYKDFPAFIIANGPSLDKNIHELKNIRGRGLIISTESAIIPLMKNNIKPDILTIIERTKYTYLYHFKDVEYPDDIALLCLGLVDKQVFPNFPGEKIPIFRNGEAINQWINRYLGDGSAIDAGANVSHLAFELAVYLGANPIVLVGQDYAFGPEGATHSKDAVYSEEKGKRAREIIKSKPVVYVESIDGTMIPSIQLWVDFKRGLEDKIATHYYKTVIDATEGGARIRGTECKKLSQVIEEYCTEPIPYRVYELIKENRKNICINERKERLENFIEDVAKYTNLFRKLAREAAREKLACKESIYLSQDKNKENYRSVLKELYRKRAKIYQLFITDDLCRSFTQQVIFAYYYLMNRIGLIDTPEKMTEIFQIQHDFFHHLNIICQSVSIHLENALELLEETLKELYEE